MRNIKLFSLLVFAICYFPANSQISLPRLIDDGVVLQRNEEVKIWGWASKGEKVKLEFNQNNYTTTANGEGKWEILLPPQPAGGPHEMLLTGNNKVKISNILFGDVWIASGQSNMELSMEQVKESYLNIIGNSENEEIRQFIVPQTYNFKEEQEDLSSGTWRPANPENLMEFSAVAYFFARELHEEEGIPIGIINSALGGSPVESWLSEEALKEFPDSYAELQKFKDDELIKKIEAEDRQRSITWFSELNEKDQGLKNNWKDPALQDQEWNSMEIPGYWADTKLGETNGVVWFRKEIEVPENFTGRTTSFWLGRMVDLDSVFVNGHFVGTTSYQYPQRRYEIAPEILKPGKNTITVRLINQSGRGGFIEDKPYFLATEKDTIDLKGEWKYKLGAPMPELPGQTFIRWKPTGLYNSMIAPLKNFAFKGVIWYQGESNTSAPAQYAIRFPAMISDWRNNLSGGKFPFLFVQLANFLEPKKDPVDSNWAQLRQAQLETLDVANTGMAVAIDVGEWNDIHPLNKAAVGKRLALQAMKKVYGNKEIVGSGPVPAKAEFNTEKVEIAFRETGGGLTVKNGDSLQHFAVSGDGVNFKWAKAKIKGDKVVVWNEDIKDPIAVRYAWADNPENANLYNEEGLPATPFELRKEIKF